METDTHQGLSSAPRGRTLCQQRLGYLVPLSPEAASEAGAPDTAPETWVLGTVTRGPNLWGAQGLMGTLERGGKMPRSRPKKAAVPFELGLGRACRDLQPGAHLQSLSESPVVT